MERNPQELSARDAYYWMTASIIPRPIAFVSTLAVDGTRNLAPFSYFMGVSSKPPTLALGIGDGRDGARKDTLVNAQATGELVVNLVTEAIGPGMVATAEAFPPDVSEFEVCGFTPTPSRVVAPPRVAESPLALECRLVDVHRVGSSSLMLAEIVWFHCDDAALGEDGLPDPARLAPLARLGGQNYAGLRDIRPIDRPPSG